MTRSLPLDNIILPEYSFHINVNAMDLIYSSSNKIKLFSLFSTKSNHICDINNNGWYYSRLEFLTHKLLFYDDFSNSQTFIYLF